MKDALDAVYLCSNNNTLEPLVNEYNSLDSMKNLEIQLSFDKDYIYIKHKDTILSKERNQ